MSVEPSLMNEKKGYDPDAMKTVVDVLDQRALMNIVTSELPSYTGSKMLKISKLGITKIEALSCLDHLNRLDLSYNKLKSVRAVGNFEELTYLNLNCNILSGKGIRGILTLENLVFLNLGNNRISVIPDFAFAKMSKLQCLLLNHNKIESIGFVSILSELNTLVLSNNAIKSIPKDAFKNLTKLRKLSLGHNLLTEFPSVFHIESLKELNLNGNKISSIPDEITKLAHLTQLDLGNNLIENVQSLSVFQSMSVLTKLNVAQNTFYGLSRDGEDLRIIDSVNKTICSMLPQLTTLNNRQLALGKEKKESRKKHYEEKHGGVSMNEGVVKEGDGSMKKGVVKEGDGSMKKGVVKQKVVKEKKERAVSTEKQKVVKEKKVANTKRKAENMEDMKPHPLNSTVIDESTLENATFTSGEIDITQSGVLQVENIQTSTHSEDVTNFLLGKDTDDIVDGWD